MRHLFLVLWLPVACAAQLTGQFEFGFTNDLPLWDVSGSYTQESAGLELAYTLSHAPNGALTGSGRARLVNTVSDVTATEITTGRVNGHSGAAVRINATGKGQFSGRIRGINASGPFNSRLALVLDASNRVLSGTESATFCVRGYGCPTLTTNVIFALPDEMTGAWTLALDITTSNNVVRGTATAEFSNGRTLSFHVRGGFRPATGLTVLNLNGTGPAFRLRLPLTLDSGGSIQKLRGKLFGQNLVYP